MNARACVSFLLSSVLAVLVVTQNATAQINGNRGPLGRESSGVLLVSDLVVLKTDSPDPVNAGNNLTYTITVTNNGPDAASNASLTDTVPAGTTFVSLLVPAGWTCTTPAVGGTGTVSCTNPTFGLGTSAFTMVVSVPASTAAGTIISNTAAATSLSAEGSPGNESATSTTTVVSPAVLSGSKTVSGVFTPGSTVTYTIVISNAGPTAQADNPGNELIDVLPSSLTLVSATATSGTAVATVGTNTVTWNGSIPAGGTVTLAVQALIGAAVPAGTTVSNQATINYDGDGNGTNESVTSSDDPAQAGATNPTTFTVAGAPAVVPALDDFALAALALLIAALGLLVIRRP